MAIEFGALPPEINSGRMYVGAGATSLLAAATAWQAIADGLTAAASGMGATIGELAVSWMGPSSAMMGMSGLQYVAWVFDTAATAEKAFAAATGAAAAYSTAFAATIPPEEVERNQITTATLIATNFFGVNSAAIAASQAQYEEYWAQDASTMYTYAATNETLAASLNAPPFLPAIPSTDPLGLASQAAAVGQAAGTDAGQAASTVGGASSQLGSMSSAMGSLPSMASSIPQTMGQIPQALGQLANPLGSMMSPLMSAFGNMGQAGSGFAGGAGLGSLGNFAGFAGAGGVGGVNGFGGSSVMAGMGRAGMTPEGRLSVPPGWGGNAQTTTYKALSETSTEAAPAAESTSYAGGAPRAMPMMMGGSGGGTMVLPNARGVRSGRHKMVF